MILICIVSTALEASSMYQILAMRIKTNNIALKLTYTKMQISLAPSNIFDDFYHNFG